jgi:hypothetical protein
MSLEARIEALERAVERLAEQIERLHRGAGPGPGPVPPAPPAALPGVVAPLGDAPRPGGSALRGCLREAAVDGSGPTVVRSYELSGGRLEALGALMLRDDVPIRVRVGDDSIEVHATEPQHCVFELFLALLDDQERVAPYRLSNPSKLGALTKLMVRDDVPVLVEAGAEQIRVHGTAVQQAIFDAFATLIDPQRGGATGERDVQPDAAAQMGDRARAYEAAAAAHIEHLQALRQALRAQQRQTQSFHRQLENRREKVDALQEKADEYEERADALVEEAEALAEDGVITPEERKKQASLAEKVRQLREKAAASRDQAAVLEAEAEALEEQARELEQHAEELERQIEDLEEGAEDG